MRKVNFARAVEMQITFSSLDRHRLTFFFSLSLSSVTPLRSWASRSLAKFPGRGAYRTLSSRPICLPGERAGGKRVPLKLYSSCTVIHSSVRKERPLRLPVIIASNSLSSRYIFSLLFASAFKAAAQRAAISSLSPCFRFSQRIDFSRKAISKFYVVGNSRSSFNEE